MSSEPQEGDGTQEQTGMSSLTREVEVEEWRKKAEEFFGALPLPSIQPLLGEHAFDLSRYKNKLSCTPDEAWQKCADVMEKTDADSCKAYREEIDTLLVFAGLFSAVVTAFTIESYQWLQSDPNDAIIALLSQIAQPGNETRTPPLPGGLLDGVSARINAYWFLSLTFSLAAALLAILCKQWVREFERHGYQSHVQYISVRQTKFEGFERWGVAGVVGTIPLLLQSALGLFALGMIELLWQLRRAVAIAVLIPTSGAVLFYAMTTVLPGLQLVFSPFGMLRTLSQCPFKSPQALLALRIHVLVLDSLWCPHCDPCPRVIFSCVEYCHRRCLVFCRRVRASFRHEDISNSRNGSGIPTDSEKPVHRHLQRLLYPWQCDESRFYTHIDRLNRSDLQFWCRKHLQILPFWRSQPLHRCRPLGPARKDCNSWITLDREFTRLSDITIEEDVVTPTSCFRGLYWLLGHTDHPGLREWIWLSVWDISIHLRWQQQWNNVHVHNLHDGVLYLTSGAAMHIDKRASGPLNIALSYAHCVELDPSFLGELFVHIVPHIDAAVAESLWFRATDVNILYPCLYALLAHGLYWDHREQSPLALLYLATKRCMPDLFTLSQQELACIIALHFRVRLSQGEDVFDCSQDSKRLMGAALGCIARDHSRGRPYYSHEVKATFSALAVAFDQLLEERDTEDMSELLPIELQDKLGSRIYLDLICSAPELDHLFHREENFSFQEHSMTWGNLRRLREAISSLTGCVPGLVLETESGVQAMNFAECNENAFQGPSGLAFERPSAAAFCHDIELVTAMPGGNAAISPSLRDHATLATVVEAPYDAERMRAVFPVDNGDAGRAREIQARDGLGASCTGTVAPHDVDTGIVISVPASSGAWASHEPDDPTAAALWLGASRAAAESVPGTERGTATHDYDGLSLLTAPPDLAPEIPGADEDAELEQACSPESGTSSPLFSLSSNNLDAAAVTETAGASPRSQAELHETVGIVAAIAGQETARAPDTTRALEGQDLQELRTTSAGPVALCDVASGFAIAVPGVSGALAGQELDDPVAAAVAPLDVDAEMHTTAAHGMQAAEASRDASGISATAGAPKLRTAVSETDGETGPGSHVGRSVSETGDGSVSWAI